MFAIKVELKRGELHCAAGNCSARLILQYGQGDNWNPLELVPDGGGYRGIADGVEVKLRFDGQVGTALPYQLHLHSKMPMRLRLELRLESSGDVFHLIPACIFGDNNHALVRPNEFPTLHPTEAGNQMSAPLWEFRADRASHPVSMVIGDCGLAALAITPYVDLDRANYICNGVFSCLPASCGVSLGYGNWPLTFVNKREFAPPTHQLVNEAKADGFLYLMPGGDRQIAHQVIRDLYRRQREKPVPQRSAKEALRGLTETFAKINYSERFGNYTNLKCRVPVDRQLVPWRPLTEIGWTGGGALAYPLLMASLVAPEIALPKTPQTILNEICAAWNPVSGFCRDVTGASLIGDPRENRIVEDGVNGWWSGFMPHTRDCHCAYTNGHAAYYLLKCALLLKSQKKDFPAEWVRTACRILDTAISLQRSDGALGYLFSTKERAVADWDGFAGCWFAAAMPLADMLMESDHYREHARTALNYYAGFVRSLNCWGTPMDTWKSVDMEGVLAFIQATAAMHELTRDDHYLELGRQGAEYEFLWRYGFRTRPEVPPLKGSGWNSCGGSVTSVSNPHVHPMGLVITKPLRYLARKLKDPYLEQRADDGLAWAMQSLELYPDTMGYGCYGVLSERFCPSDGLLIERFADTGAPSSTWWTYNGWAAASVLEAIGEEILFNLK